MGQAVAHRRANRNRGVNHDCACAQPFADGFDGRDLRRVWDGEHRHSRLCGCFRIFQAFNRGAWQQFARPFRGRPRAIRVARADQHAQPGRKPAKRQAETFRPGAPDDGNRFFHNATILFDAASAETGDGK